ncbi:DUF2877 domain-containing protein [Desemzia sp. RIT804]|uniref:DUF2877 domain-containing protein n=1 Tax=Desemzia sp. RIT 804 TaxID=2810209 RepID=UPI00194F5EA4|nr:DUF2877 domain-containing protein [Desemzia sp. RIT 804]MBM6615220.1 DUF2877 domain-containing protein [Desemzia sp. RIT 804]
MSAIKRETKSNFLSLYFKNSLQMGSIHTLFENSLNVQFPFGLIHIGQIGMPLSPFGCLISTKEYRQLHDQCQPGDLVRYKQGNLYFYTQKNVIKVELDIFEEVDLSIPELKPLSSKLEKSVFYQVFVETLFSLSVETGLPLNDTIKEGLKILAEPNRNEKRLSDEDIIGILIGRGIGLTPSGDDILIGYTFARMLFQEADEWKEKVAAALQEKKTTAISEAYFSALLKGYINENFLYLAQLVTETDRKKILDTIQRLKRFGHTSGTDTLYGFALGLHYVQKKER